MKRIFGTLLMTFAALTALDGTGAERPNIVIFHCHDLGQHLHCYGIKTVRTPNLDKFAAQGVRFARRSARSPVAARRARRCSRGGIRTATASWD